MNPSATPPKLSSIFIPYKEKKKETKTELPRYLQIFIASRLTIINIWMASLREYMMCIAIIIRFGECLEDARFTSREEQRNE